MSGRPRRACRRCNIQKVRCDGLRPTCQRCQRLNHSCVYEGAAPLPDGRPFRGPNYTSADPFVPLSPAHSSSSPQFRDKSLRQDTNSHEYDFGVPPGLFLNLIDVYFSHVYNANLLLRRRSLLAEFHAGAVRPHVLLSICAFASIFYRDDAGKHSLLEHGFSLEWAKRAGKLVCGELDEPVEENIVTFLNLALFWYSQGEWQKTFIYKCNGLQIAHLLGLSVDRPREQQPQEAELHRRRFWATYLITTFAADTPFPRAPSDTALILPLPSPEEEFETEHYCDNRSCLSTDYRDGSIYGELIRVMTLWTEVYELVQRVETDFSSRASAIQKLDSKISDWWSHLPSSLELSPSSISLVPQDTLPLLFLIHVVYHQCLCALHSSIVPLFSWTTSSDGHSYARQISAQVAFEHATAVSLLADAAVQHSWDLARTPSYVGYAAYCACAILIPFMWCIQPDIKERAKLNVVANLTLIRHLGRYWRFIALLGVNARTLYEMHAKSPVYPENEPRLMEFGQINRLKPSACPPRARTSILGHNNILVGAGGAMAQNDKQVTDLGFEERQDETNRPIDPTRDTGIASFIVELSSPQSSLHENIPTAKIGEPAMPRLGPNAYLSDQEFDMQQSHLDPVTFNEPLYFMPFDMRNEGITAEHIQSFDDWLSQVEAGGMMS